MQCWGLLIDPLNNHLHWSSYSVSLSKIQTGEQQKGVRLRGKRVNIKERERERGTSAPGLDKIQNLLQISNKIPQLQFKLNQNPELKGAHPWSAFLVRCIQWHQSIPHLTEKSINAHGNKTYNCVVCWMLYIYWYTFSYWQSAKYYN